MLAKKYQEGRLKFPAVVQPKYDGVRALVRGGVVYSRTNKPIPNKIIQAKFGKAVFEGFDGELCWEDPTAKDCYRRTVSAVMSKNKKADGIVYFVFDKAENSSADYGQRYRYIQAIILELDSKDMVLAPTMPVSNEREVSIIESILVEEGYEGVIVRNKNCKYKNGRGTLKGELTKIKRFEDTELTVIDVTELCSNYNPAEINELGKHTSHSHHKENLIPQDTLGAVVCLWEGKQFQIGTGFSADERQEIWDNQENYIGKLAKFKYFAHGMKDVPRHPVFLGWRSSDDK